MQTTTPTPSGLKKSDTCAFLMSLSARVEGTPPTCQITFLASLALTVLLRKPRSNSNICYRWQAAQTCLTGDNAQTAAKVKKAHAHAWLATATSLVQAVTLEPPWRRDGSQVCAKDHPVRSARVLTTALYVCPAPTFVSC